LYYIYIINQKKSGAMRTVFPEKPARDFNEWIGYIKSEIDKSNGKGEG
jgi:hypothetical protein